VTKKDMGIGRDKDAAFNQAIEANLHVKGLDKKSRLVDRISGTGEGKTVKEWSEKFDELLKKRGLAESTLSQYASNLRRMRSEFGDETKIRSITALMVSDKIEAIENVTPKAAQKLRGFLHDSFREAKILGWVDENPVRDIRMRRHAVKRSRLTFEVFTSVYQRTEFAWLKNAMALALVSGQARDNIAGAVYSDFREGGWWVVRGKTDARIFLPLELRLGVFGLSLGDALKQCRATRVLSKHLIHQTISRAHSALGKPLRASRLTKAFAEEIAALGIDWADKTPPSFHEIRSLSERLYKAQGGINTQALLGHKNAKMTELYDDARGSWVRLKVPG
jgi:integrase